MPDLVVTVPQRLWFDWIDEGDAVGEPDTGEEWGFSCAPDWKAPPAVKAGERLYVVAWGRLRGYAPVVDVRRHDGRWWIVRRGGAVACTIEEPIKGFRGYRSRWWPRGIERPFPGWMTEGVPDKEIRRVGWDGPLFEQVNSGQVCMRVGCSNPVTTMAMCDGCDAYLAGASGDPMPIRCKVRGADLDRFEAGRREHEALERTVVG